MTDHFLWSDIATPIEQESTHMMREVGVHDDHEVTRTVVETMYISRTG